MIRGSKRRALLVGVTVTIGAIMIGYVVPLLVSESTARRLSGQAFGNPLRHLRLFGGFAGGFTAGAIHTATWPDDLALGLKAATYGLACTFVLHVTYSLAVTAWTPGPVRLYVAITIPALYSLVLLPTVILGGPFGAFVGGRLRHVCSDALCK